MSSQIGVSILARPFERALRAVTNRIDPTWVFQSSPALSSGRYAEQKPPQHQVSVSILARPFERALLALASFSSTASRFQSSPALSSGRYDMLLNVDRQ